MKAKQYEVIGSLPVHGHVRGERFWATYAPEVERILREVGHIAVVLERVPRRQDRTPATTAGRAEDDADRGASEAKHESKEK